MLFVLLPVGWAVYSAVSSSRQGDDDEGGRPALSREGSTSIDGGAVADSPLAFETEPTSYALTYRTERYDADGVQVSTDRLQVRRPFESRVTGSVGGEETSTRASRLGVLAIATDVGARVLVSPPAPATGDVRLASVLADAVEEGYAEVRERRRVLDVECQVYRVGSSVSAGELVPVGTEDGEHADVCVDAQGLLLEEVWFQKGRPLQRRVAITRTVEPSFDDELFALADEEPISVDDGNGIFRALDPASGLEGVSYRLASTPEGFGHVGRFLVQPPRLGAFQNPLEEPDRPPEQVSVVDVWTRGPDLLVFSQTIAAAVSAIPTDAKTASPVDIGPFGNAATVLDLRSVEVRIELPEARFLRLAGTIPRDQLVNIARTLRAEVGTGPVGLNE